MLTSAGVYLDAAATAPLRPEAHRAMLDVLAGVAANPSSVHSPGFAARQVLEQSRATVAAGLGALPEEVVFTSGGTEANALAIMGLSLARPRGRHIITTAIEHSSVVQACRTLERVFGFTCTELPVDSHGLVRRDDLAAALRPDTTLVTIGLANAEVGTVQPIAEIAELVAPSGALLHTDAVQAAATLPVGFGRGESAAAWPGLAVHAMSVASHKFGGPQGVGALLLRTSLAVEPLLPGGGQESGRRSGTQNVAGIAGFAAAVAASRQGIGANALALSTSRDALVAQVLRSIPSAELTGHPEERLPGHASFVFAGVSGESLLVALDTAGFAVSSGSACAANSGEPSPVLLALGVDPDRALSALRLTSVTPLAPAERDRLTAVLARAVG